MSLTVAVHAAAVAVRRGGSAGALPANRPLGAFRNAARATRSMLPSALRVLDALVHAGDLRELHPKV